MCTQRRPYHPATVSYWVVRGVVWNSFNGVCGNRGLFWDCTFVKTAWFAQVDTISELFHFLTCSSHAVHVQAFIRAKNNLKSTSKEMATLLWMIFESNLNFKKQAFSSHWWRYTKKTYKHYTVQRDDETEKSSVEVCNVCSVNLRRFQERSEASEA